MNWKRAFRLAQREPVAYVLFYSGTITGDVIEDTNSMICCPGKKGRIVRLEFVAEVVNATGNAVIHLLKGNSYGSTALGLTASAASVTVNPGAAFRRFVQQKQVDIPIDANDCFLLGVAFTATIVGGITLIVHFVPD